MSVVVIVLAVVAAALLVVAVVGWRRLSAQRALTAAAEERAAQQAAELAAAAEARDAAERARAEADERAGAAEAERAASEARATGAAERTAAAEAAREDARREAEAAAAARLEAEERLAAFEARAAEATAGELDAQVMWALEKSRSERTWRHSVAVGAGGSPFAESSDPLREALQIELDAAREEVGAVVDLDAELPGHVSAAGAVLTLRAAQELLAGVVRRSESTVLRVRADGADLVVEVESIDEDGNRVAAGPLATPPSPAIETTPNGVRVRGAVAS